MEEEEEEEEEEEMSGGEEDVGSVGGEKGRRKGNLKLIIRRIV